MTSYKTEGLDALVRRFKGYVLGENGFDELDFKEALQHYWKSETELIIGNDYTDPIEPRASEDFELRFCESHGTMTNHLKGVCQKREDDDTNVLISIPQASDPLDRELDEILDEFFTTGTERHLSELKASLLALIAQEREKLLDGLNESIMRGELPLGTEPDQAFNNGRIHRWIDSKRTKENPDD